MRLNNDKLNPSIFEKFKGLIWKIKINNKTGLMAIESRNLELKQVYFTVFDIHNGKINFKEKSYEEVWNLSLAHIGKENLLITGFEHSGSLESKGILSVNLKDGSLIWQKFNMRLNQVNESELQVYDPRIYPRKYSWIDHLTAENLNHPIQNTPESNSIILPEIENPFKLPEFIKHQKIRSEFLTLIYKDIYFVSFHEQIADFIQQRLIVYQGTNILLDDILISGIQKLQPEAFFIQHDQLFYIRNKHEIISYLI